MNTYDSEILDTDELLLVIIKLMSQYAIATNENEFEINDKAANNFFRILVCALTLIFLQKHYIQIYTTRIFLQHTFHVLLLIF